MTALAWTAHQVADALGLTVAQFRGRRARLEAAGFPPPLPGLQDRWSIRAVEAWAASEVPQGGADAAEAELIRRAQLAGAIA
jgi:hypothetical protein